MMRVSQSDQGLCLIRVNITAGVEEAQGHVTTPPQI